MPVEISKWGWWQKQELDGQSSENSKSCIRRVALKTKASKPELLKINISKNETCCSRKHVALLRTKKAMMMGDVTQMDKEKQKKSASYLIKE